MASTAARGLPASRVARPRQRPGGGCATTRCCTSRLGALSSHNAMAASSVSNQQAWNSRRCSPHAAVLRALISVAAAAADAHPDMAGRMIHAPRLRQRHQVRFAVREHELIAALRRGVSTTQVHDRRDHRSSASGAPVRRPRAPCTSLDVGRQTPERQVDLDEHRATVRCRPADRASEEDYRDHVTRARAGHGANKNDPGDVTQPSCGHTGRSGTYQRPARASKGAAPSRIKITIGSRDRRSRNHRDHHDLLRRHGARSAGVDLGVRRTTPARTR